MRPNRSRLSEVMAGERLNAVAYVISVLKATARYRCEAKSKSADDSRMLWPM